MNMFWGWGASQKYYMGADRVYPKPEGVVGGLRTI